MCEYGDQYDNYQLIPLTLLVKTAVILGQFLGCTLYENEQVIGESKSCAENNYHVLIEKLVFINKNITLLD